MELEHFLHFTINLFLHFTINLMQYMRPSLPLLHLRNALALTQCAWPPSTHIGDAIGLAMWGGRLGRPTRCRGDPAATAERSSGGSSGALVNRFRIAPVGGRGALLAPPQTLEAAVTLGVEYVAGDAAGQRDSRGSDSPHESSVIRVVF